MVEVQCYYISLCERLCILCPLTKMVAFENGDSEFLTRAPEFLTGDPRWYSSLLETPTLNFFFTRVDATRALSRDVTLVLHCYF